MVAISEWLNGWPNGLSNACMVPWMCDQTNVHKLGWFDKWSMNMLFSTTK